LEELFLFLPLVDLLDKFLGGPPLRLPDILQLIDRDLGGNLPGISLSMARTSSEVGTLPVISAGEVLPPPPRPVLPLLSR